VLAVEVALVYSPDLDAYRLPGGHPLRPERVSLAVALMRAYGLVRPDALRPVEPTPASDADLLRVHDAAYVDFIRRVSRTGEVERPERGIGPLEDTRPFVGMHEASTLIAGATKLALELVLGGSFTRAFAPAGGLHHARRDRASGFCVYNDVAVAIASALAENPDLRVAYIDIDAHHSDGVQAAFYESPHVLTVSLHESGAYLFPGTGFPDERGRGKGLGFALNVPLPPYANGECYRLAFVEAVVPAVRAFRPDVVVAQCGADAHHSDPLTHLALTLPDFRDLYERIISLAEELCGGRIVAMGGGGYSWASVVPRAWTLLAAALVGEELPAPLPAEWLARVRALGIGSAPATILEDEMEPQSQGLRERLLAETRAALRT
jgi:acetoin utilization protein AcuC